MHVVNELAKTVLGTVKRSYPKDTEPLLVRAPVLSKQQTLSRNTDTHRRNAISIEFTTIRFNILLGVTMPSSKATQEEIEVVCRDANILDFIQSDGFDTEAGGKGSQLSGGQKRRCYFALAY
ncbi:hypothetical protein EDC04DRAFT_2910935 [Pisolithus marmoratus]|nr:hypothetical protein EDC04DRAFT_2910935 [Pisolithus marmoratus]